MDTDAIRPVVFRGFAGSASWPGRPYPASVEEVASTAPEARKWRRDGGLCDMGERSHGMPRQAEFAIRWNNRRPLHVPEETRD